MTEDVIHDVLNTLMCMHCEVPESIDIMHIPFMIPTVGFQ